MRLPRAVVLRLARDVIDVAGPILRHSPCLTAADLELIMVECGSAHAAIIAMRLRRPSRQRSIGRPRPDGERSGPQAAELSDCSYRAQHRAPAILLIWNMSAWLRRGRCRNGERDRRRLETAALSHNVERSPREVECALGISAALARRIVVDDLASRSWLAKALRAPRAVLERILLFVNPRIGQSVQRVYELATAMTRSPRRRRCAWLRSGRRATRASRAAATAAGFRRPLPEGGRPASPLAARRPLQRDRAVRSLVIADRSSSATTRSRKWRPGAILDLQNPASGSKPDLAHDRSSTLASAPAAP